MRDGGIGRILVAALHQGIADVLPDRLEFYENWFHPGGLRAGRIGLAPITAVLSFLRREGDAYAQVMARAGTYAGDWTVEGLPRLRRRVVGLLPRALRARAALGIGRAIVHETYGGSRAVVLNRRGRTVVDIRSSIFCGVREPVPVPLCGFYEAAFARVLARFDVPATFEILSCRATGRDGCHVAVRLTSQGSGPRQPAASNEQTSDPTP
jgi:predicted hydrocarbon binding protein